MPFRSKPPGGHLAGYRHTRHKHRALMPRYKEDPIPSAPFVRWVDQQIAALERDHQAFAWKGNTGSVEQVCYRLGWQRESGSRRLHRWRTDGHAERQQIEDALHCAGVAMEDVYQPPTPAWRARMLLLQAVADMLVAQLVTLRYCPQCCEDTLAVDECLWCDTPTVDRSPLRDDPATGPMLEQAMAA